MKPYSLSVKMIVTYADRHCLLLKRSASSKNNPGVWDLPGGKVDPGESFYDAILREVFEETGIVPELTGVVGATESENTDRKIAYMIMSGKSFSENITISEEHEEYCWATEKQIADMDIVPHLKSIVVDWIGDSAKT